MSEKIRRPQQKIHTLQNNGSRGVALLYSILLTSIVLAMVFVLSIIFGEKLRMVSDFESSLISFFAADSGIESCLYQIRKQAVLPGDCTDNNLSNNASYQLVTPNASTLRSIGTYRNASRALEISGF